MCGRANHTPGPALLETDLLPPWLCPEVQQREPFPNIPRLLPPHPSSHPSWQLNPSSPLPSSESWNSPWAEALTMKSSGTARAGGSGGATGRGKTGCSHGLICSVCHRSIPTSACSRASSSVCRWAAREPRNRNWSPWRFTAAISLASHQARVQGPRTLPAHCREPTPSCSPPPLANISRSRVQSRALMLQPQREPGAVGCR